MNQPELIKIFQFSDESFLIQIIPQNDMKTISDYISNIFQNNKLLSHGYLPQVMTISIQRFADKSNIKNFSEIIIDNDINVTVINEAKEISTKSYVLFGVVIHNGIYEKSGYYVGFLNKKGIWYEINNLNSFIVSEERVFHFSNFKYYKTSMLFYIDSMLEDQIDSTLLQIDPDDLKLIKLLNSQ